MPSGGPRPCPNNGGKRAGAGRKPGAETKRTSKTNDLAVLAAGEGVLPLQVMLEAMRKHYDAGQLDKAAAIAKDAACYVHHKKAALTIEGGETPLQVKLVRDDNFYQNADRLPPSGNGASAAHPPA